MVECFKGWLFRICPRFRTVLNIFINIPHDGIESIWSQHESERTHMGDHGISKKRADQTET